MLTKTQIDWLCYKYAKMNKFSWCHFQGTNNKDPFLKSDATEQPLLHVNIVAACKDSDSSKDDDDDKELNGEKKIDDENGHLVLSTYGLRRYTNDGENVASIPWQQLYDVDYEYTNKVFKVNSQGNEIHIKTSKGKGFIDEILLPFIDETLRFNLLAGEWEIKSDKSDEMLVWDELVARLHSDEIADENIKLKKEGMSNWVSFKFILGLLDPKYVNGEYNNEERIMNNAPKNISVEEPTQATNPARPTTARPNQITRHSSSQTVKQHKSQLLIDINNTNEENTLLDLPGITKSNLETFFSERRRRGGFKNAEEIVEALGLAPHFAEKINNQAEFKTYTGPVGTDTVGPHSRVVDF